MPEYLKNKKINFNEDIIFNLIYDQNRADELSYKLDIIYQDNQVATFDKYFTNFRFRFTDLDPISFG
jgi:hypothetical protein